MSFLFSLRSHAPFSFSSFSPSFSPSLLSSFFPALLLLSLVTAHPTNQKLQQNESNSPIMESSHAEH